MSERTDNTLTDIELDSALAKLKPQVQPENDLWPGIAAQLPARKQAWWQGQTAIAASFVIALIGLGSASYSQFQNQQLRLELSSLNTVSPIYPAVTPVAYDAETTACLQPSEIQVIQNNLAIIQSAMDEINLALEKSPNSASLSKRLLDLSKQQINLINRANTIAL